MMVINGIEQTDSEGRRICPRCKKSYLTDPLAKNSLSNIDNVTLICNGCGVMESKIEFYRFRSALSRLPKKELEVDRLFKNKVKGIGEN